MFSKKLMCLALGVGIGIGVTYLYSNSMGVEQKIKCLKRKLKKLERDMENALDKLKPEQMQKYKFSWSHTYIFCVFVGYQLREHFLSVRIV